MTSRERVIQAARHNTTDRIPITFDAEPEVYQALYQQLGLTSKEDLFEYLNCDTWMLLPRNFVYTADQLKNSEKTSIWGYRSSVTQYNGGQYEEITGHPLAGKDELADIDNHPWPPDDTLDFSHFPVEAAAHSDRAVIGVFTWGAFHIAALTRGMADLMLDFAMRQTYAEHLLNTITERVLFFLDRMLQQCGNGIDIVYMCDDYCSQQAPLFSPAHFGKYVTPYLRAVVEKVHSHNKIFLLHVCGAVRPLLPQIVECGVDMLEPLQVSAVGMDPLELKREFGRDLCFYGGVDLIDVLSHGTPEEVANTVHRLIDTLGKDGGYILGPAHTYIQIDAPVENILAMYSTATGYYPWTQQE